MPDQNAMKGKTKIEGWLKTQKPPIKKGNNFYVDGPLYECHNNKCDDHLADGIQVDSNNGKILSTNFLSEETYVKV